MNKMKRLEYYPYKELNVVWRTVFSRHWAHKNHLNKNEPVKCAPPAHTHTHTDIVLIPHTRPTMPPTKRRLHIHIGGTFDSVLSQILWRLLSISCPITIATRLLFCFASVVDNFIVAIFFPVSSLYSIFRPFIRCGSPFIWLASSYDFR